MRRAAAVSTILLGALLFLVLPTSPAEAQYSSFTPETFDCSELEAPGVSVSGADLLIEFAADSEECISGVTVQINPVLYRGPMPASKVLNLTIPALGPELDTVVTTSTLFNGDTIVVRTKFTPLSDEDAAAAATAAATNRTDAAPGDEVAGVDVAGTSTPLAHTGSTVSLTASLGALLIGAGGLTLLADKKYRQTLQRRHAAIFLG